MFFVEKSIIAVKIIFLKSIYQFCRNKRSISNKIEPLFSPQFSFTVLKMIKKLAQFFGM